MIATPTASGKSPCFHLPVLAALAENPNATALFVYPTKALSRDQEHSLRELMREAGLPTSAMVFDADAAGDARRAVRERCRVVLTNPDMLHAGILPNHPRWASLFQGLRFVVLGELHTYRGVFGSHMAHVLGRLRRVATFHGTRPTFISATATIGNPREHAARLHGVPPSSSHLSAVTPKSLALHSSSAQAKALAAGLGLMWLSGTDSITSRTRACETLAKRSSHAPAASPRCAAPSRNACHVCRGRFLVRASSLSSLPSEDASFRSLGGRGGQLGVP